MPLDYALLRILLSKQNAISYFLRSQRNFVPCLQTCKARLGEGIELLPHQLVLHDNMIQRLPTTDHPVMGGETIAPLPSVESLLSVLKMNLCPWLMKK